MKSQPIVRIEAPMPDILNKELESYIEDKVIINDSFYLVDRKEVYLQGILTIKQSKINEKLEWLLWVRTSAQDFIKMSENLSGATSIIEGILVSSVFMYENTKGINVQLEFELKEKMHYPKIQILSNHKCLYNDFKYGIEEKKYLEWQKKLRS